MISDRNSGWEKVESRTDLDGTLSGGSFDDAKTSFRLQHRRHRPSPDRRVHRHSTGPGPGLLQI